MPAWVFARIPLTEWDPTIWQVDRDRRHLYLRAATTETRTHDLAVFLARLRERGIFEILSAGWRDELYPIYGPGREVVVNMERSATPLFGVVTYGVHMTCFVRSQGRGRGRDGLLSRNNNSGGGTGGDDTLKIWVPIRAAGKQTYPGMMDNTVAGGLGTGEGPLEGLVREASEEASLPPDLIRRRARPCGTVTYLHLRDSRAGGETGLCQPECQYVYEMELDNGDDERGEEEGKEQGRDKIAAIVPKPNDDEVQAFQLMTVDQVQAALADGRFKPNCAAVMLDFFIRHGILTPENEPDYIEIVSRLHRRLPSPTA